MGETYGDQKLDNITVVSCWIISTVVQTRRFLGAMNALGHSVLQPSGRVSQRNKPPCGRVQVVPSG